MDSRSSWNWIRGCVDTIPIREIETQKTKPMAKKKDIQLKINEITRAWEIISDLATLNQQPFAGYARRLLFKMQPEIKYINQAKPDDLKAIADKAVNFGEKIPPPQHFPDEYVPMLEKLCSSVPVKKSQIEAMIKKSE